jgi:hypothetical protein
MTATEFQPSTHRRNPFIGAALGVETHHLKKRFQRGFNTLQREDPSTLLNNLTHYITNT